MYNTPWAFTDDGYYRVNDGKLLFAPANNIDYTIELEEEIQVDIVTAYQLENINRILGTHYTINEINSL